MSDGRWAGVVRPNPQTYEAFAGYLQQAKSSQISTIYHKIYIQYFLYNISDNARKLDEPVRTTKKTTKASFISGRSHSQSVTVYGAVAIDIVLGIRKERREQVSPYKY